MTIKANFRIDEESWAAFQDAVSKQYGVAMTASEYLRQFCQAVAEGRVEERKEVRTAEVQVIEVTESSPEKTG